eukprot:jgi/Chlat1/9061/Chrsp94S08318
MAWRTLHQVYNKGGPIGRLVHNKSAVAAKGRDNAEKYLLVGAVGAIFCFAGYQLSHYGVSHPDVRVNKEARKDDDVSNQYNDYKEDAEAHGASPLKQVMKKAKDLSDARWEGPGAHLSGGKHPIENDTQGRALGHGSNQ